MQLNGQGDSDLLLPRACEFIHCASFVCCMLKSQALKLKQCNPNLEQVFLNTFAVVHAHKCGLVTHYSELKTHAEGQAIGAGVLPSPVQLGLPALKYCFTAHGSSGG